jgi:hypothetical protein
MVRWSKTRVALVCLAGLAVNAAIFGPALALTAHGTTDFMGFYAGGKLAFTPGLYNSTKVMLTEQTFEGMSSPTRLFMRLPVFSLFYWPFAQLKYPAASAVWEALCVLSLLAFALFWPRRQRRYTFVAACWSLPAMLIVAEGQDIGFVLLSIAVAFLLMRRRFPVAAGLAASLCMVKFHLFLMIPVWICARRQWRFAAALCAGCAALLALSFLPGGWNWPLSYLALLAKPSNTPYRDAMPTMYGLFGALPHAVIPELIVTGLIAFAVWIASRANAAWGLAAALAGGVLAAPHAYMADGALAVPALLLVFRAGISVRLRALCYFLASPVPWLLLMCGSAIGARLGLAAFVVWLAWGKSAHRFALTSSGLLASMNNMRRWAGTDRAGAA